MGNLSDLSDADFDNYSKGNLKDMSDAGFALVRARADASAPTTNLFTDSQRIAQSFGNPAGSEKTLKPQGYQNPRQTPDGQYVADAPDGMPVRDASNFFRENPRKDSYFPDSVQKWLPEHPVNWAEAHVGQALPEAGKAMGGAMGGMEGLATGPAAPVVAPVAGAAYGAAGGAAGESLRQAAGRAMGTFDGNDTAEIGRQAVEGAEGGAFGALPLPFLPKTLNTPNKLIGEGVGKVLDGGRRAVAYPISVMSGLKDKTVNTLIKNPWTTLSMGKEGADLALAKAGQEETQATVDAAGSAVGATKESLNQTQGPNPVPPELANGLAEHFDAKLGPYTSKRRDSLKIAPSELADLQGLQDGLYTKLAPQPANQPYVGSTPPNLVRSTPVAPTPIPYYQGLGTRNSTPMVQHSVPGLTVADLQELANAVNQPIGHAWDKNPLGPGKSPEDLNIRKGLIGPMKDALHQLDPDGYGVADSNFSGIRSQGELLKQLNDPAQQQGFTHTLAKSPIKDNARAAAKELAPNFASQLDPLAAADDLSTPSPGHLAALRIGAEMLGLGAAAGGHAGGNPALTIGGMAAMAAALGTHPRVVKFGLGATSAATSPIWSLLRSRAAASGITNLGVAGLDNELNPRKDQ